MKRPKKVILCDIAGTISFQSKHNQMFETKEVDEKHVDLKDPVTGKICRVWETPVQDYKMYTDPETTLLLEGISRKYLLVYVTGARLSSIEALQSVLAVPHATIMESGAVIRRAGFYEEDQVWAKRIHDEIRSLIRFVGLLKTEGWVIDDKGRTSAVRIFPQDNPGKSFDDLAQRVADSELLLKTTWNVGGMDIVPKSAGKGNAVRYLLSHLEYSLEETIGIGDDINDLEMLEIVKEPLIVRSAHQEILRIAGERGWFISENFHFAGINEILRSLLAR